MSLTMHTTSTILVALLAIEHAWIVVLEMFLWTKPYGLRTFGYSKEQAELMATLAKNMGLYNGFLSAGLFWGLLAPGTEGFHVKLFFSGCVLVAGLYGAATTGKKSILIGQGLLGGLALGSLLLGGAS
jgi:putative membrane protein